MGKVGWQFKKRLKDCPAKRDEPLAQEIEKFKRFKDYKIARLQD